MHPVTQRSIKKAFKGSRHDGVLEWLRVRSVHTAPCMAVYALKGWQA